MLKAQKRLTKRQIKEDKFVTFYFKAQDFLKQYTRPILYGIGGVLAVFIIAFIVSRKQLQKEQNAIVELTKAKIAYFDNNLSEARTILKNLTETYSGSESADEGLFYLANVDFKLRNFVEAEKHYNQFLNSGGDELLKASALAGVAACLEEQQNYSGAAKIYREASEKYSDSFLAPQNLLNSARCYSLAGENEQARTVLNLLIEKYSTSSIKNEAEIMLSELPS